jgi:hypothetical protein
VDTQHPAVPNAHPVVSAQIQLSTCEDATSIRGCTHPLVTWVIAEVPLATPTMQAVQGSWVGLVTRRAVEVGLWWREPLRLKFT